MEESIRVAVYNLSIYLIGASVVAVFLLNKTRRDQLIQLRWIKFFRCADFHRSLRSEFERESGELPSSHQRYGVVTGCDFKIYLLAGAPCGVRHYFDADDH